MALVSHPQLAALALVQGGAFRRAQALELGITDRQLRWALANGDVVSPEPGVYLLSTAPPSFMQSLWVARLAIGGWAAVSHEAAGRLHRYSAFARWHTPVLLVTHGAHPRLRKGVVHQTRDPWLLSTEVIDGLIVTSKAATIVDLAATTRRGRLALVLDDAAAAKLLRYDEVGVALAAVARRGKPGVRLLGSLLDERGPGYVPPLSLLERDLMGLFDTYGGPTPKLAWDYPGREQVNGCADAGFDDALLAVETDGRRWHTRIAQIKLDHERDNEAARHGVQVLRVLHEHVVAAPRETWELIQQTRLVRLEQLGRKPAVLEAMTDTGCRVLPPE